MDASRELSFVFFTIVIILMLVQKGLGIRCYECNSKDNAHCLNLKSAPENVTKSFEIDCDGLPGDKIYTKCRVIIQNVESDPERIIRQCATHGPDKCYYRVGTSKIRMDYCHCQANLCNSAVTSVPGIKLSLIMACFLYLYRLVV
ncbi:hypothetical protein CHS0354_020646 [Potamilus streckersoni]|uniref:Protein sleepless n=1 Tax=Potamilus streckersoni TaxID=2493646 RepID=A0AAE0T315_9BIVA|nr:hypothetical protein CHS0354_020646 [Potamilus streckersoni]